MIAFFTVLSFLPNEHPAEIGGTGGINNSSQRDITASEIKKYDICNIKCKKKFFFQKSRWKACRNEINVLSLYQRKNNN